MKCLVSGGSGFLGREIVERLLAQGDRVVSIARRASPELSEMGVECHAIDLADRAAFPRVVSTLEGVDCVFHTAAKAGYFGDEREFHAINVEGTRLLLEAARRARVARFVYTSSPSVTFDGRDHVGAGDDLPLATRFLSPYPRTKAQAETLVLAAHRVEGMATVALRPHLIIGPRDPHLVPRLVARARARRLFCVGDGRNEVTLCAVENAAHAHVLAAAALHVDAPHGGRAYFIGQERPVRLWEWIDALLARLELPPARSGPGLGVAYAAGACLEAWWKLTRRRDEPPMTRFLAMALARSHSYDMAPARRDFGYVEIQSLQAATTRIVRELRG